MSNLIKIHKLGDLIKYNCDLSQSYIIFMITPTYIIYDECKLNWNEPKIVIHLLNYAFQNLLNNYKNILYFRYYISFNEFEYIDKNKWIIIKKEDENILLECELKDAFDNIIDGFMS
jgi:hypothetical protein